MGASRTWREAGDSPEAQFPVGVPGDTGAGIEEEDGAGAENGAPMGTSVVPAGEVGAAGVAAGPFGSPGAREVAALAAAAASSAFFFAAASLAELALDFSADCLR
jgi:hypothetical protein